ncbi:transglycosylase SLT domain-containing protein [Vibrio harveyi]|uniref:transglycosylase SLT domain-containing protein n=1 Tax=Vibrio harveyi TaxID=669 RepID=UPI0024817696|nr:transglycosylase SLT domain-containing protein [Vibrio harveyi]
MDADLAINHQIYPSDLSYYQELIKYDTPQDPINKCILQAAKKYKVHPDYIYTLSMAEGGTTGKYRKNNDGTHDMGIMQINYERWAIDMPRIGYQVDWRLALKHTCTNIEVGTIIFKHRAKGVQNELTAMANYHWFVNVDKNKPHYVYKKRIARIYLALQQDKERFANTGKLNGKLRCRYASCN